MKNIVSKVSFILLFGFLASCVSMQDRTLTNEEMASANIIGRISIKFTSFPTLGTDISIKQKAYTKLYAEARKKYQGNVDVVNISLDGSFSFLTVPLLPIIILFGGIITPQTVTAHADVVLHTSSSASGVEDALARAAKDVAENISTRTRIAIVYITAQDRSTIDFITGELEHILQRQGFVLVDRSELDRIRNEQQFGASGEVDDNTAARMGHIAGASVVITGRVDGEGNLRRLRLRALDTTSAQVIGTASERL